MNNVCHSSLDSKTFGITSVFYQKDTTRCQQRFNFNRSKASTTMNRWRVCLNKHNRQNISWQIVQNYVHVSVFLWTVPPLTLFFFILAKLIKHIWSLAPEQERWIKSCKCNERLGSSRISWPINFQTDFKAVCFIFWAEESFSVKQPPKNMARSSGWNTVINFYLFTLFYLFILPFQGNCLRQLTE